VIFGDPDNYVERGFKSCQKFNVWAADNTQPTAMLVKVLKPNVLDGRKWTYHESPAMSYDKEDANVLMPPFQPRQRIIKLVRKPSIF
jgi:putative acetyltransferase